MLHRKEELLCTSALCEQHKESKKNNPESSLPCVEPEFCILSCLNFSPAFEHRWCNDGRWKLKGGVGHLSVRWILFSCTANYLSLEVGGGVGVAA